jgi:hypothetical protein
MLQLFTLFVFVYVQWCSTHIDCVVLLFLRIVYPFSIAPSSGGFRGRVRGVRPPPKIRKAYVIQR